MSNDIYEEWKNLLKPHTSEWAWKKFEDPFSLHRKQKQTECQLRMCSVKQCICAHRMTTWNELHLPKSNAKLLSCLLSFWQNLWHLWTSWWEKKSIKWTSHVEEHSRQIYKSSDTIKEHDPQTNQPKQTLSQPKFYFKCVIKSRWMTVIIADNEEDTWEQSHVCQWR